jgi:hypothetical protein
MYSRRTPVSEIYIAPADATCDDHVIDIDLPRPAPSASGSRPTLRDDVGKLANVTSWLLAGKTAREMDEDRFLAQTGVVGVVVKDTYTADDRSDAARSAETTPETSPRFEDLLDAEDAPAYLCLADPLACSRGAVSSPRLSRVDDPLACSMGATSSPRLSNWAELDFLDRPKRPVDADMHPGVHAVRLRVDTQRSLTEPVSLPIVSLTLDVDQIGRV